MKLISRILAAAFIGCASIQGSALYALQNMEQVAATQSPKLEAAASRFLDLFFDEQVTPAKIMAAVDSRALEGGTGRIEGLLRALNNHFERPESINLLKRSNGHYSLILKTGQNTYADMRMEISEETGFKVGAFQVTPHRQPLSAENAGKSDIKLIDEIDTYMEGLAAKDEFSGTVLIAKDGKPIYMTFIGEADKATGRKNTIDTPINLGSMNKTWTSVAVAQLVERGLLDWDDLVGKHLPTYPNAKVRDKVTLKMLLSHRSGLQAFATDADFDAYRKATEISDLITVISDNALLFEPDTAFQYSNAGPMLLGAIIEAVTGEDYYAYVRKNILEVAGMTRSGFFRKTNEQAGFARGYFQPSQGGDPRRRRPGKLTVTGEWQPNYTMIGLQGSPAGGAYASAPDLLRFAGALQDGTLLKPETFQKLITPQEIRDGNPAYGYLFITQEENGHFYWGHNGGAPGIQADFSHFPKLGFTAIVLSNYGSAALPVSRQIRHWLSMGKTAKDLAGASQSGT